MTQPLDTITRMLPIRAHTARELAPRASLEATRSAARIPPRLVKFAILRPTIALARAKGAG